VPGDVGAFASGWTANVSRIQRGQRSKFKIEFAAAAGMRIAADSSVSLITTVSFEHEKTRGGFLRAGVTNFSMMPLCQCFARRVKRISVKQQFDV